MTSLIDSGLDAYSLAIIEKAGAQAQFNNLDDIQRALESGLLPDNQETKNLIAAFKDIRKSEEKLDLEVDHARQD